MTEADEHEQRLLALEREIIAMREDMEAAIARAEAAEERVRELEEALRPDLLEGAADEIEHLLNGGEPTQTEAQIEALRNYAAIQHVALFTAKEDR